ncbi:MAG: flagellar basal body P-ring formation chaperone FlgA [bacterium]
MRGINRLILIVCLVLLCSSFVTAKGLNLEQRVEEVIRRYVLSRELDWKSAQLIIKLPEFQRSKADFEKYGDNNGFKIDFIRVPRLTGKMVIPIQVTKGNDILGTVYVLASISAYKPVVVTAKKIKKSKKIEKDDLVLAKKEISNLPDKVFEKIEYVIGVEAKTTLPAGSIIMPWMVQAVTVVKRGDRVNISVTGEGVEVKAEGIALESGFVGKKIRVRSDAFKNKKELEGIVVSSSIVEVKI